MSNKLEIVPELQKFREAYKKCKALKSKVLKDSYDELLQKIKAANKECGIKSKKVIKICQLNAFFQTTKNAIDTWLKENEKAQKKAAKGQKIKLKYDENLNKKRRYALLEFSNCCASCMSKLKEIDEYIEKAKKANEIKVPPAAVNENKGMIAAVYDTTADYVSWTWGGIKAMGGHLAEAAKGVYNSYKGTPQSPSSKQRCHIAKVFDIKNDTFDLLRCYICVELNLGGGIVDGIQAPIEFDFKKYEFDGNNNYTDECFKYRTIYKAKTVKVNIYGLGDVMLHVFISPNPTKTGGLVSVFAKNNCIKVDEKYLTPLE